MPKLKLIEEPRYAGGMCIVLKKPKTHAFSLSFVLDSGGVRSGRRKSISPPSFVRRRIAAIEDYGMCILISQNSCTLRLHMIFLVVYSGVWLVRRTRTRASAELQRRRRRRYSTAAQRPRRRRRQQHTTRFVCVGGSSGFCCVFHLLQTVRCVTAVMQRWQWSGASHVRRLPLASLASAAPTSSQGGGWSSVSVIEVMVCAFSLHGMCILISQNLCT